MPLILETYNGSDWIAFSMLKPIDRPGSVSNNKPDGTREVYLFECSSDDSCSTIYCSSRGLDAAFGETRAIINLEQFEIVKELRTGEAYEMSFKLDGNPEQRRVRFTHKAFVCT